MTVDELRKHLSLFDGDTPIAMIDPDGFGHGYKVLMWNPKSYEPFGSFRQQ